MQYRFATTSQNYSHYASGRVFYSAPRQPAFPLRLGSEIFQQALALWQVEGGSAPCTLYDPCCGGAYLLTVLAYLHWPLLKGLIASDIDTTALTFAQKNLGLLTPAGLATRLAELRHLQAQYGKPSHTEAIESVAFLQAQRAGHDPSHPIETHTFQADITTEPDLLSKLQGQRVDIVVTDVPYGRFTAWGGSDKPAEKDTQGVTAMLATLAPILHSHSIVAIATNKGQAMFHPAYKRLKRLKVGKRQVIFLKLELTS